MDPRASANSCWGELLAADGEFWRPPAGRFLSAYGEDLMAVDTGARPRSGPPGFGLAGPRGSPRSAPTAANLHQRLQRAGILIRATKNTAVATLVTELPPRWWQEPCASRRQRFLDGQPRRELLGTGTPGGTRQRPPVSLPPRRWVDHGLREQPLATARTAIAGGDLAGLPVRL